MRNKIILFLLCLFIWLALSWSLDWQHIFIGIIVSLFVCYFAGDLFITHQWKRKGIDRYFWLIYYFLIFFVEVVKANLDVAYRVVHPNLPIRPGIVKVKTKLKSDAALTYLANSITLTPGTFVVDIDKENGYLYIHWINVVTEDVNKATEIIVRRFEEILEKIFE